MPAGATSEDIRKAHEERAADMKIARAVDACSPLSLVVVRVMAERLKGV
jgi:hypothetical protein